MKSNVGLATLLLLAVWVSPAFAYLDPASGGLLVQLILGGIAGVAIALKVFWRSIAVRLGFSKTDDDSTS